MFCFPGLVWGTTRTRRWAPLRTGEGALTGAGAVLRAGLGVTSSRAQGPPVVRLRSGRWWAPRTSWVHVRRVDDRTALSRQWCPRRRSRRLRRSCRVGTWDVAATETGFESGLSEPAHLLGPATGALRLPISLSVTCKGRVDVDVKRRDFVKRRLLLFRVLDRPRTPRPAVATALAGVRGVTDACQSGPTCVPRRPREEPGWTKLPLARSCRRGMTLV